MNSACLYTAFGLCIESEFELPGQPLGSGIPDIYVRLGRVLPEQNKANDETHVMYNGIAGRFRLSRGTEIVVDPLEGADQQAVRLVLLGKAMAALLRQRGWLPLHGSAVAIDGRAVLFLGRSGAGKSTIAGALYARGHDVITDDIAAVRVAGGRCVVVPASPRLRMSGESLLLLRAETYSPPVLQVDKYAVNLRQPCLPTAIPVSRIYMIEFGEDFLAEAVPVLAATVSLSFHSFFQRSNFVQAVVQSHVRACAEVAETVPITRLVRPRSFPAVQDLVRWLEADVVTNGWYTPHNPANAEPK